ncbi:hypothetical protein B0H13DRAFT_2386674 [Mycena leptocephala]|nr:hypothetical protein B0H13DRAFT_2386674 [Mycena leptocephala]
MGKKTRKRVAKEKRRNLRLWADGVRESVLSPHIAPYTDALDRNWRDERDYLQSVCNEFHARISWRLEDHEEPELPLPEYNPRAPAPVEELDEEETRTKRARVDLLNARIRRWLKYRARRLHRTLRPKLDPRKDPWAILLAKLSGFKNPPKAQQAYEQYMREAYQTEIAPVVAKRWAEQASEGSNMQTAKEPGGGFRAQIARELFAALPESEREGYQERAKEEAAQARAKYDEDMGTPPPGARSETKMYRRRRELPGSNPPGYPGADGTSLCCAAGRPHPEVWRGAEDRVCFLRAQQGARWSALSAMGGRPVDRQVTSLMKEYLQAAFSPSDIKEAALPDPLEGAKYTMGKDAVDEPDDDDDSGNESDSSESSDSNADSDDTDAPAKKKRKRTSKGTRDPS